jgi:hypothetical protein
VAPSYGKTQRYGLSRNRCLHVLAKSGAPIFMTHPTQPLIWQNQTTKIISFHAQRPCLHVLLVACRFLPIICIMWAAHISCLCKNCTPKKLNGFVWAQKTGLWPKEIDGLSLPFERRTTRSIQVKSTTTSQMAWKWKSFAGIPPIMEPTICPTTCI